MGKIVRAVAGVGIAAVGVITGNPQLIASGIGLTASSLVKKPKAGKAARDRLQASINPTAPRTIVFGRTAMATDIRYDAHTGTDQEFYHLIIATSAHKATSHEEIYFGGELAWSSGVVQTKFSSYLTVTSILEGSSSNVVEIDARWGSAAGSRLTGCSYVHLRFKRTGNSKKAESPFASSVPTDIVIVGKGIPVYDPSKDSTVPGGSGSHRADNQATWEFTSGGVDIGRNPALCELTYKLGWRINSIVSVGRGIDPAYLDLPSYITAKNNCNETVALATGGSEPRYRIDTVYDESESGDVVLPDIRNVMNAYQTDDMGALGLVVRKNDLGTFTSFGDDDILSGVSWQPLPGDVEEFKNIGVGKYSDPRPTALFQLADFPEIRSAAIGGIDRVYSEEFAAVQSASQAQRLIKQKLQRLRYTGVFKANFGPRAYALRIGSVVSLTCARYAMTGKLFRVLARGVPYNGAVPLTLQEENAAIYAWDAEDSALVTPTAPTVYDYLNDPFLNPLVDFKTQVIGDKPEALATAGGNLIFNANAETGDTSGWSLSENVPEVTLGVSTIARSGQFSFIIAKPDHTTGFTSAASSRAISVKPGDKYIVNLSALGSHNTAGGLFLRLQQSATPPASGTVDISNRLPGAAGLTDLISNGPVTLSWIDYTNLVYTVPDGVYFVSLAVYNWAAGPAQLLFEGSMQRQSDAILGQNVKSSGGTVVSDAMALNSEQLWGEVGGSNRPADNATVGATWGVDLGARPANLSLLSGSEAILNGTISIAANGQLLNAGGGAVTIAGLGYIGQLNATFGANWATNVSNLPANLALLGGTEPILNSMVTPASIGFAGALNDLDPSAAATLAAGVPAKISRLLGEVITKLLTPSQTATFTAAVRVDGSSTSGTVATAIQVSPAGLNSWSNVQVSGTVSVGPGEPGGTILSNVSYTNTSGVTMAFDFRVIDVRSPSGAGGNIVSERTYLNG